jgi:hypothetical protein
MTSEILLDTASEFVQRTVGLHLDPAQRHRLDYWLHHTAEQRGVPAQTIVEEIAAEGPALQACLDELTVQEIPPSSLPSAATSCPPCTPRSPSGAPAVPGATSPTPSP